VPVKIENWSIFRKDRDKSLWVLIFGSPCMLFKTCLEPGFEKVTDILAARSVKLVADLLDLSLWRSDKSTFLV